MTVEPIAVRSSGPIFLILIFSLLGCGLPLKPRVDPFYAAILQRNPEHPAALYAQGTALKEQGRFAEAATFFAKLGHANPENPESWLALGQCWLELSRFSKAKKAFERSLKMQDTQEGHLGLALALLLMGRTADARQQGEIISEKFGPSAALERLWGDVALVDGAYDMAQEHYEQSLQIDPGQPRVLRRLEDLRSFRAK